MVAGAIGQWPLGRVSDHMDRRKIILVPSIASVIVGAAVALSSDGWANGLLGFPLLFGFFVFPLYALCAAHMNDWVPSQEYVDAAGLLLFLYAAGAIAGLVLGSGVMHFLGPSGRFFYTAAVHATLVVFIVARLRLCPRGISDEHEPFAHTIRVLQRGTPGPPLRGDARSTLVVVPPRGGHQRL